jgi:prevent-host-death family protein
MGVLQMGAEQFRRQLTDLLNRVGYGGDQVIIERYGAPIAVLLPYSLYASLEARRDTASPVEQVPALAAALQEARQAAGLSYEDLARQLQAERLRTLREKYPDFAASDALREAAQGVR